MDSYGGDGRQEGFSLLRENFRTKHVVVIDPDLYTSADAKIDILETKETGISVRYDSHESNQAIETKQANPATQVFWSIGAAESAPCKQVVVYFNARGVNPVALSRYVLVTPQITYVLKVTFDLKTGEITALGSHDGFPAYAFFKDGKPFYKHSTLKTQQTPFSLFGGGEFKFGPLKLSE